MLTWMQWAASGLETLRLTLAMEAGIASHVRLGQI
jgi:hypothetical protein